MPLTAPGRLHQSFRAGAIRPARTSRPPSAIVAFILFMRPDDASALFAQRRSFHLRDLPAIATAWLLASCGLLQALMLRQKISDFGDFDFSGG